MRIFGVSDSLEEPVGGLQDGDGDFGAIEVWSEASAVTLARFAEEHGANWRSGAEGLFDQARAFDSYGAGFGRKAAAKRDAEFLEPAVIAAGDDAWLRWLDARGHGVLIWERREKINTEGSEERARSARRIFRTNSKGVCCFLLGRLRNLRLEHASR